MAGRSFRVNLVRSQTGFSQVAFVTMDCSRGIWRYDESFNAAVQKEGPS
jgi:hypothetical protein